MKEILICKNGRNEDNPTAISILFKNVYNLVKDNLAGNEVYLKRLERIKKSFFYMRKAKLEKLNLSY